MLTSHGVGLYSLMCVQVIPNTSDSVDEVKQSTFLFSVYTQRILDYFNPYLFTHKKRRMTKQRLFLYLLFLVGIVQSAMAQEPYAVLSDDNTVLTFYYDSQMAERDGMSVGPFEFDKNKFEPTTSWYPQRETITTVVFDASFANCTSLTSTAYWFWECTKLNNISGIENLKTDNVTNMYGMFFGCESLTSLDLSGFNTDRVT